MPHKIYPKAAFDASIGFQIELDSDALEAMEEIENHNVQGAERETILQKHLGEDYDEGYQGTAWGLHGISEGLTPARLAEMLAEHGESFDPCADRETFDHSMMVDVESELNSQLEYIPERVLDAIVESYKRELIRT